MYPYLPINLTVVLRLVYASKIGHFCKEHKGKNPPHLSHVSCSPQIARSVPMHTLLFTHVPRPQKASLLSHSLRPQPSSPLRHSPFPHSHLLLLRPLHTGSSTVSSSLLLSLASPLPVCPGERLSPSLHLFSSPSEVVARGEDREKEKREGEGETCPSWSEREKLGSLSISCSPLHFSAYSEVWPSVQIAPELPPLFFVGEAQCLVS